MNSIHIFMCKIGLLKKENLRVAVLLITQDIFVAVSC